MKKKELNKCTCLEGRPVLQILALFQAKKCHFSHPFSDLASNKLCHHYLDYNANKKIFLKIHFEFAYFSFFLIRFELVSSKTIPDSRPKWAKSIPVFRPKPIPFGAARTYYPPGLKRKLSLLSPFFKKA